jgi:two-component system chemotaxis response regulator CheB
LPGSPALELRTAPEGKLGCLALGASTGGLHALSEFLRALPGEIGAPILITQHLPADFMSFFARQIETASGRRSTVAEDGRPLEADRIYIAPGGAHLGLRRCGGQIVIALDERQGGTGCMPSVDTMLSSVSQIYGRNCAAIIFSGMGRDGLAGSTELASRGGTIFVQSADSSAVWGMPRAVAEAGLASAILSPVELARRVIDYARDGSWK